MREGQAAVREGLAGSHMTLPFVGHLDTISII